MMQEQQIDYYKQVLFGYARVNTTTQQFQESDMWCRINFVATLPLYIGPLKVLGYMENYDNSKWVNAGAVTPLTTERTWTYLTSDGQQKAYIVRIDELDDIYIRDKDGKFLFKGKNVK